MFFIKINNEGVGVVSPKNRDLLNLVPEQQLNQSRNKPDDIVETGVQFDMAIYTKRNHSIRGGNINMRLKEQLQ